MCTQEILNCLPNETRGILAKEISVALPVAEWQKQGATWDVLLTEEERQQISNLLLKIRPEMVRDVVDIHNESYGAELASYPPTRDELAHIFKDVFIFEVAGIAHHSLNVTSESKMAELHFRYDLEATVKELSELPVELLKGFHFSVQISL